MAARKDLPKRVVPASDGRGGTLRGTLLGTLLLMGLFVGGWWLAWQALAPQLLSSARYQFRPEHVEISPLPRWIHTDLQAEVFRTIAFDHNQSILDDQVTQRFHDAFALHPWVAKVRRVSKIPPSRIKVELEYRRPVCMVQVPRGLYPVDADGVFLPTADFSPVEANAYPLLVNVETMPVGTAGMRWGDARVLGGAQIAAAFGEAWNRLGLRLIVPSAKPVLNEQYAFELTARSGTRIVWGLPPGSEPTPGASAAEKVARLLKYFDEHNSLDGPAGAHQLDIRNPNAISVGPVAPAIPADGRPVPRGAAP